jgi:tRNA-splicing endonuclease subunit sen54 N-term
MKETVVKNDSLPLDILVNKKSAAVAIWQSALGLAEVTQMRGNFWRTTGTTHPKTALFFIIYQAWLFY